MPETSTIRPAGRRFRSLIAVGVLGLVAGMAIGALAIGQPAPAATPITVDSFPREIMGLARDDIGLRDAGSAATVERLDADFQAQLEGFRFAYGGDGAALTYGRSLSLTIVNGQLAPEVPLPNEAEWTAPAAISLDARDTTCVSLEGRIYFGGDDQRTDRRDDPLTNGELARRSLEELGRTECVLFDRQRNLALRLSGRGPSNDALDAAGQFRDELERIHASLVS